VYIARKYPNDMGSLLSRHCEKFWVFNVILRLCQVNEILMSVAETTKADEGYAYSMITFENRAGVVIARC
jgi:hypothetical protein